ncbi:MAG: TetR/AcrR family transcriptional regulator [Dehalococcoidia bacterium]
MLCSIQAYTTLVTTLSQESVITAGADLVREVGWPRLSVRAVAARLGVTPMALYRHIPSGDALSDGVITKISEGLVDVRNSGDTFSDLERWARRAHTTLVPFPGAAAHLLATWFQVVPVLRAMERLLEVAHAGGLRDFEAVAAVNAVFMYVLMRAEAEQTVHRARVVRRSLRLATEVDLPHLSALAEHYTTARFDLHFDYGLRVLLNGIAMEGAAIRGKPARGG